MLIFGPQAAERRAANPQAAASRFLLNFEQSYGRSHPEFFQGSYNQVWRWFGSPPGPTGDRRDCPHTQRPVAQPDLSSGVGGYRRPCNWHNGQAVC